LIDEIPLDAVPCVHAEANFSPDGSRFAYISKSRAIRLCDAKSGKEIRYFRTVSEGLRDSQSIVAFSPDGRQLVFGGPENTILVWDVQCGKKLRSLEGHSAPISFLQFTPAGRLLSGSGDGTMRLWDLETGKGLRTYRECEVAYSGSQDPQKFIVACSPSGFVALSWKAGCWGQEGILQLWGVETGEAIRKLQGHVGPINCAAFSPDGRRVLTGSGYGHGFPDSATSAEMEDHTMRLWDVATGKELACYKGHSMGVTAVAFSPDGKRASSGSHDTTVRLWALPDQIPVKNQ
jgi:WD40 repeat protein